jgi:hypothetical protein
MDKTKFLVPQELTVSQFITILRFVLQAIVFTCTFVAYIIQ